MCEVISCFAILYVKLYLRWCKTIKSLCVTVQLCILYVIYINVYALKDIKHLIQSVN